MPPRREQIIPGCYDNFYSSDRFGVPEAQYAMGIEFYGDEDPRVIPVVSQWGDEGWIIGRTVENAGKRHTVWVANEQGQVFGFQESVLSRRKV